VRLLPQVLGIGCRGVSSRLKEALYDFGLEDSFRLAAYRLQKHYGFSLSAERTRLITLEKSEEVVAKNAAREPVRTLAGEGAEKIVTQCDGSLFRSVETGSSGDARKRRRLDWKEARLCAASAEDSATIYYEGLVGDVHETGKLWGHCTQRAGWAVSTYIQSMGDGAPWIEEQARDQFSGEPLPPGYLPRLRIPGACRSKLCPERDARSMAQASENQTPEGEISAGDRGTEAKIRSARSSR